MSAELATRPEAALATAQGLMPALSFNQMAQRYNAMQQMAKEIMRKDVDYGIIPGTDKPALYKPGAEKLCALFGLRPMFVVVREIEDWDKGLFYYWYKSQLYSGDRLIGEGEGSANSKERKHRYRKAERICPTCQKAGTIIKGKEEYGGGWLCYKNKGGCGAKWPDGASEIEGQEQGMVENTEPFDLINTLQKMAQKRALVAATLIVTSASDFFTQDVEDMVDVEFRPAPEEPSGSSSRPAEPQSSGITPAQITALSIALKDAGFGTSDEGKAEGRAFIAWSVDLERLGSARDLTKAQAQKVLDMLGSGSNGSYKIDRKKLELAIQEYAEWRAGLEYDGQFPPDVAQEQDAPPAEHA